MCCVCGCTFLVAFRAQPICAGECDEDECDDEEDEYEEDGGVYGRCIDRIEEEPNKDRTDNGMALTYFDALVRISV